MSKYTDKITADSNSPLVIVNPKSAAGATRGRWAEIASDLRSQFGAFQVAFTKSAGEGLNLALRGAEQNRPLIIACGGDGTINEVANGILESGKDIELAVLPSGTGGDFRRTIKMPAETRAAAQSLRTGKTQTIDVGRVTFHNFQNELESRYFLNISSFGLSAAIIENVKTTNSFKWIPNNLLRGKASFALSALQEVFDLNPVMIRVKIDGQTETSLSTINFCVCNARYFGGGMQIAPEAKLNDGLLNIVNIGDIKTARIIRKGYKLYRGTHLNLSEVKSSFAKKIEVAPFDKNTEIFLEIDGELLGKLPAVYEIVPNLLRIRVPNRQ